MMAHFWIDSRPFFVELWRRIEQHRIPNIRTKTEACRSIGCSTRWAQLIVAGKAGDSNKHKTSKARTLGADAPKLQSDEDYADDIARYASNRLQLLMARDWPRCREVCASLEEFFAEVPARRKS
jgi:hypothetical protein